MYPAKKVGLDLAKTTQCASRDLLYDPHETISRSLLQEEGLESVFLCPNHGGTRHVQGLTHGW